MKIKKFLGKEEFINDDELRKIKDRLGIVLNRYKKKKIIDKSPPRKKEKLKL